LREHVVDIRKKDIQAPMAEGARHDEADAAGAARDKGGLAPEILHYAASF
jgi:hypothetical protein